MKEENKPQPKIELTDKQEDLFISFCLQEALKHDKAAAMFSQAQMPQQEKAELNFASAFGMVAAKLMKDKGIITDEVMP